MANLGSTTTRDNESWRDDAAVAAIALQPFVLLLAATVALQGVTPQQLAAADPLIQLLGAPGVPLIILFSGSVGAAWWLGVRPDRVAMRRGLRQGASALLAVAIGLPAVRVLVGPSLPTFIPPEESSRPGLAGGLAAGVFEEGLFRLIVLPAVVAASALHLVFDHWIESTPTATRIKTRMNFSGPLAPILRLVRGRAIARSTRESLQKLADLAVAEGRKDSP